MSTEHPTPEQVSAENRLICEKLLGWELVLMPEDNYPAFKRSFHEDPVYAPCFTRWAEAGLILDALASSGANPTLDYREGKWDCYGGDPFENFFHAYADTGPLAIRAAALEHIRVMKL